MRARSFTSKASQPPLPRLLTSGLLVLALIGFIPAVALAPDDTAPGPGPVIRDIARALGLNSADIVGFDFSTSSGTSTVNGMSFEIRGEGDGIFLSTGLVADGGTGDTDLLADGQPDRTSFRLTLQIPDEMKTLSYSSHFTTTEHDGGTPDPDKATVTFSTGVPRITLAEVGGTPVDHRRQLRAVDVSSVSEVTVKILVEDAVNGDRDSGLLLLDFFFTESEIADADALASFLLSNSESGPPIAPVVEATSGDVEIIDVLSAKRGRLQQGSLLLTTGLSSDGRFEDEGVFGDTDLAKDEAPDATLFHFTLDVPQDGETKSLVYSAQFLSFELDVPAEDRGTDEATAISENMPSGSEEEELGRVASSSSRSDPPFCRAIDVNGATQVRVTFRVSDGGDLGRRDSGLLVSNLYFSTIDAELLDNPRPSDSQLNTGTYAYSRALLGGSGQMLPFALQVHYNSSPRRTSGRMGPRWGHSYDWGVIELESGDILVRRGDGSVESFEEEPEGSGEYEPSHGRIVASLVKQKDGSYIYETTDQTRLAFDPDGKLESITDSNGNEIRASYDSDGLLASVLDTRMEEATFEHDSDQRLTRVEYAAFEVLFGYDDRDDLRFFVNANGDSTAFTYDEDHNLKIGTDGTGVDFVTNQYDELHRVTESKNGRGFTVRSEYGPATLTTIDAVDNRHVVVFDPLDRAIERRDGTGATQRFGYDDDDNQILRKDARGFESRSTFTDNRYVRTMTNPRGDVVTRDYDPNNRILAVTDELGKRTAFLHDPANGNLLRITNPNGDSRHYGYDQRGLNTQTTDGNGNVYRFRLSPAGDREEVEDPMWGVERREYDRLGRIVESYDANGNRTSFAMDAYGRITRTTNALGDSTTNVYDAEGRLLAETNELGETQISEYSPTGLITKTINAMDAEATYSYDGADRLTVSTDRLDRDTLYDYDAAGRLQTIADPRGGTVSAVYDSSGNRTHITDPNDQTTEFVYDGLDRVVEQIDPLGRNETNAFDERGRVSSFTNARKQIISYVYDDAARLSIIRRSDHEIVYVRDANGNRIATMGKGGRRTTREYDALNRLSSYTGVHNHTIRYEYDAVGNVVAITYSDGKRVLYTYDVLNRMRSVTDWEGRRTTYDYDAAGRLVSAVLPDGSTVDYGYNRAGLLTSMMDTSAHGVVTYRTEMTLDDAGVLRSEEVELPLEPPVTSEDRSFVPDAANQIFPGHGAPFEYDEDGNVVRGVVGRLPVDLAYDDMNRLVSVGATQYEYDEDGLRIEATVNGETTRYVHDPNAALPRVLEEHDDDGEIVARYVYGLGLISRHGSDDDDKRGDDDEDSDEVSVYHFDSRGSTVAITDLEGQVTDRYAYDPYGLVVARDDETPNPFKFNGRDGVQDDGNGLYFMRTRYYEPRLMRFISQDDLVLGALNNTQSLNRYAYARGNPSQYVDPGGDFGILAAALILAFSGAVINGGAEAISTRVTTGEVDWAQVGAAAVGGAIAGGLTVTGHPALAAIAGEAVGSYLSEAARTGSWDPTEYDWVEIGVRTTVSGLLGRAGGKVFQSKGQLLGKGLIQQLDDSGLAVTQRYTIHAANRIGQDTIKAVRGEFVTVIGTGVVYTLFEAGDLATGGDGRATRGAWKGLQHVGGLFNSARASTVDLLNDPVSVPATR